ncbi:MAG: helix-turn-helix transcriptional regulator [Marinobacter sp.]|uniref:helix-turn-helix transcriptional regulator n=1 Tax=Marinobacter sp. TaxID=50741 RepID=UPI00299E29F3|nr:helix-turn-helix transcriptional regulator [Marinobacter sp.]MDX1634202.1 helix-turn-helix transcriptional regulator [Marinobacter sp.]
MGVDALGPLVTAMVSTLQSAGVSRLELARYADVEVEQLDQPQVRLSPSQLQRLWLLIQHRVLPSLTFGRKVRALIAERLAEGRVGVEAVAAQLNMSRYTLYKRLKEENLTFLGLLDEVRREQALSYLQEPERPLTEVAELLGFSELSAFSRAFKRWMGTSPAEFRAGRADQPGVAALLSAVR